MKGLLSSFTIGARRQRSRSCAQKALDDAKRAGHPTPKNQAEFDAKKASTDAEAAAVVAPACF